MSAIDEFSGKLKLLRKEKNLQQGELAEQLRVSRGSISFYENGDRVPDIELLYRVSAYFNVSADWLLGLSDERVVNGDLAQAARYTGLSANSINKLHKMAESSQAHPKALLWTIEQILQYRPDDFITWAWRAAMASCAVDTDELAETRHNADVHLVEMANARSGGPTASVEVPLSDYEYICTSTAIGIIQRAAEQSLHEFKDTFKRAFQSEKSKE